MRITIENLPPIASGSFELRPLTIFIGPNNTGKSRAALLPYVMTKHLEAGFPSIASPIGRESLEHYWENAPSSGGAYLDLIHDIGNDLTVYFRMYAGGQLGRALRDYIPMPDSEVANASIRFDASDKYFVQIRRSSTTQADVVLSNEDVEQIALTRHHGPEHRSFLGLRDIAPSHEIWSRVKASLGLPTGQAFIFPAERGSLAGVAGYYLDVVLRAPSQRQDAKLLPPTSRDYLSALVRSAIAHTAAKHEFATDFRAVETIERDIMRGEIQAAGNRSVPFPLVYSNTFEEGAERFTIEISQASSSVAEVGPIAMILKSHVKPGDLVAIDEPETNLHPASQRNIARAMVQLAAAGVTVVATTHSSTIVHQISNLVRAHELSEDSLKRLGWGKDDTMSHESVGVYLFKPGDQGVNISEIPFDAEYGYPEEEFYEVAERMVDETYRIDTVEAFAG